MRIGLLPLSLVAVSMLCLDVAQAQDQANEDCMSQEDLCFLSQDFWTYEECMANPVPFCNLSGEELDDVFSELA